MSDIKPNIIEEDNRHHCVKAKNKLIEKFVWQWYEATNPDEWSLHKMYAELKDADVEYIADDLKEKSMKDRKASFQIEQEKNQDLQFAQGWPHDELRLLNQIL